MKCSPDYVCRSNNPNQRLQLTDCVNPEAVGRVEVQFSLAELDLRLLKLNAALGTGLSDSFLSITAGSNVRDGSNELRPLSFAQARQVGSFTRDTTRPQVLENGFLSFDLNTGRFTIAFDEPVNASTSTPVSLFQHQAFAVKANDAFSIQQISCMAPECANNETITFALPREELNRIKLAPRICSSGSTCWLTIPPPGNFVTDMAGNLVREIQNGDRSTSRLPLSFVDDVDGPILEAYTLNLTSRELILSFDEPVEAETFNTTGIALQSRPGVLGNSQMYRLTGGVLSPFQNGAEVTILLSDEDVNALQSRSDVASSMSSTYLSMESRTARDLAYRQTQAQAVSSTNPLLVSVFESDRAPPEIMSFDLDLDSNSMTITFTEPVFVSSLNLDRLVVASSRSGGVTYDLNGGTLESTSLEAASVITFTLTNDDLTFLEVQTDIATGDSDTFLASDPGFAQDTNSLSSIGLPVSEAVQVSGFTGDSSPANVVSFSLDMDEGEAVIAFDDVILGGTFDVGSLTFQSARYRVPLEWHTLSESSSSSSSSNGFEVTVNIGSSDLNRLKQIRNLTTSRDNSYLTLTATLANDVGGVDVVAITDGNALQVSQFNQDITRPSLDQWSFDLNVGQAVLTFSETVNIRSLQPAEITILSAPNSADSYTLTGFGTLIPPDADYRFAIELSEQDANIIKSRLSLGTGLSNSYISITRSAVDDMNGNDVREILPQIALPASAFDTDSASPMLRSFSLDANTGLLRLIFDETVNAASFNVTAFTFVNRAGTSDASYALRDSSHSTTNSSIIDVNLSSRDLNALKAIDSLATSPGNTFLTATPYAVRDMNANRLAAVPVESAVQVGPSAYTIDTTAPFLETFTLDVNAEQLLLTFSETVSTIIDTTQITLQSEIRSTIPGTVSVTLQGGAPSRGGGGTTPTVIVLQLQESDANELKRIPSIATNRDDTYIWFSSSSIQDQAGNTIIPISEDDAFQADAVVTDVTPPRLVSFTLDLDLRQLELFFDETVDSSTFASTLITLQDAVSDPLQFVPLGSFSRTDSPDGTRLLVELSTSDFNAITATFPLATMDTNTYISLGEGVVRDTAGVASSPIPPGNALLITSHAADLMRPSLSASDFDLNVGVLTLEFSESVNVTSFDPTQITIQSDQSNATYMHTLRGGVVTQRDSTIIDVSLNSNDLNGIKKLTDLASRRSDTYISITSATVADMNRNMVVAVTMSDAMLVRGYSPDETGPLIQGFDLDYNSGVMTLYVDETIDLSSTLIDGITLQSSEDGTRSLHTLTDSTIMTSGYETFIQIQLSSFDLNELKRLRICTSMESCSLSASSELVRDVRQNQNMVIPTSSAISVGSYFPDISRPTLASYVEFDLDEGLFTLEFSEIVDVSSLNATQITLDNDYANATHRFELESLTTTGGDNFNVTFLIESENLNALKLNTDLCTHDGNCWIRFTENFIMDASGNRVVEILPNTINTFHRPQTFIPDTTPPILLSYTIDLDSGAMTFTFDEVILLGTFTPMNITFQNEAEDPEFALNLREYGESVRSPDGLTIYWNMTIPDLNLLKSYEYLFSSPSDSYLMHSNFVEDISGTGIGFRSEALRVSGYAPDVTRPVLQYFRAFNFDNATLTLQFDEPVNISTLNLDGDGFAIAGNRSLNLSIYDRIYINDWYSVIFENGTVYNLTHTFDVGEYVLNCPFSLDPTDAPPTTDSDNVVTTGGPMATMLPGASGSGLSGGSGSGSGFLNLSMNGTSDEFPTTDAATPPTFRVDTGDGSGYPILLRGCVIFRNLSVEEPFKFLTGGVSSYVDERKQQVQIALNRADLRFLKLSFFVASNGSDTWVAYNESDLLDMSRNEVAPTNLFNATQLEQGRFVDDVTPPTFEFGVLDMNASVLFLHYNDVMDGQSVQPLLIEISEYPGSNNSYSLEGPYPYPTPLTVDQRDDYVISIPLSFADMNALKNNLELATSEQNTYLSFTSDVATDIYGRNGAGITDVQVRALVPDETGPVLEGFSLDYENRLLILTFDEVVNPNTLEHSGITIQNSPNSSLINEELPFTFHTFIEGGTPVDNTTGVYRLELILDVDMNALIVNPDLGETVNDIYITIDIGTVLDMSDNPNQRVRDGNAIQVNEIVDDTSPPTLLYYDLNLNDNLLIMKFSEAVRPDTFNASAITLLSTPGLSDDPINVVTLSQNSRIDREEFNSLLLLSFTPSEEEDIKNPRSDLAKSAESTFISIEREAAENYLGFRVQNISVDSALAVQLYFEGKV